MCTLLICHDVSAALSRDAVSLDRGLFVSEMAGGLFGKPVWKQPLFLFSADALD